MSINEDMWSYRATHDHQTPEGYRAIIVYLTDKEHATLYRRAARLSEGTLSAAIRDRMALPEVPYGLKAVLARWKKATE